MPWVATCLNLLSEPLLGYCLALKKLALQVGLARDSLAAAATATAKVSTAAARAPGAMERKDREAAHQEKATRGPSGASRPPRKFAGVVIVTTGLPARGKSQIARCLARRLNWNGETAKVMRVSDYRRKRLEPYASHELFQPDHEANAALRVLAQRDAMHDCASWLAAGNTVAILDATLVTRDQRSEVYEYLGGQLGYRVLFLECVCTDPACLESNCREILRHSPDYADMEPAKAAEDLRLKIAHYEEAYHPMNAAADDEGARERDYPRIRIDTASMEIGAFNVAGHVETSVLGYLGNISLKPHTLYFSRHGESEFNVLGRIGGDAVLSARGERYAQALAAKINSMRVPELRVLTSRLRRTIATARGIEAPQEHVAALNELYAGVCEGLTYEEMQERYPREFAWRDQDKLRYRYPWGESYLDTMRRVEPVIVDLQQSRNVLVVSHQAVLRCVIGFFLDKTPEELPYMEVPLHTIIRMSSRGFEYGLELVELGIECVNTTRCKPQNCSAGRTADDALVTVPKHYDMPDPWRKPGGGGPTLVQQH